METKKWREEDGKKDKMKKGEEHTKMKKRTGKMERGEQIPELSMYPNHVQRLFRLCRRCSLRLIIIMLRPRNIFC